MFVESKLESFQQHSSSRVIDAEGAIEDDETVDFHLDIPLHSIEGFKEFDEKLLDKDFSQKVIKFLIERAEVSSVSKTARSVLRQIMDINLCKNFSLKGQQRKDQQEKKESFLGTNTSKILRKCIERLWPRECNIQKQLESTVATWLAQQGSTSKKILEKEHQNGN